MASLGNLNWERNRIQWIRLGLKKPKKSQKRARFKHQNQTPSKKATIYIETLPNWDPKNEPANPESVPGYYPGTFGSRFFGGVGGSQIRIHGRKMERTWTLLR